MISPPTKATSHWRSSVFYMASRDSSCKPGVMAGPHMQTDTPICKIRNWPADRAKEVAMVVINGSKSEPLLKDLRQTDLKHYQTDFPHAQTSLDWEQAMPLKERRRRPIFHVSDLLPDLQSGLKALCAVSLMTFPQTKVRAGLKREDDPR